MYSWHLQCSHHQTIKRTDKTSIFPWKEEKIKHHQQLHLFFSSISQILSLKSYLWPCKLLQYFLLSSADQPRWRSQLTAFTCSSGRPAKPPLRVPPTAVTPSKTPPAATEGRQRSLGLKLLTWKKNYLLKEETGRERCGTDATEQWQHKTATSTKPVKNKWQTLRCPPLISHQ